MITMQQQSILPALVLAISALTTPLVAAATSMELKTALQRLLTTLPGEYDSEPQRFFEAEYKTPVEQQHARMYRAFTRIDAPEIGPNVVVGVGYEGGKSGTFKDGEFLVWTLAIDDAQRAVRMTPWQFQKPADYKAIATDAAKLQGLPLAALEPATGARGCAVLWEQLGGQLRGRSETGTCDGDWLLNDDELWINVAERADQTHWRFGKARPFECFYTYQRGGGLKSQTLNGFRMHDRVDVYELELADADRSRPAFIELIRGMWPSNSGRNYTDLLRMQVYVGKRQDEPEKLELIGNAISSADTDRVGFASRNLSVGCKLIESN